MPRPRTSRANRIRRSQRGALGAALVTSVATIIASPSAIAQTCQPGWALGFALNLIPPLVGNPGFNGHVNALTVFDDGAGPALYAGGNFTTAGGATANRIAKWNGSSWSPLGVGVTGTVEALTVFDDGTGPALFVGGCFTAAGGAPANFIAKERLINPSGQA